MSSAIFFVKIYRRLHIAILVPTKKDSILVEGKSLEFALFVDLDWDFSLIEWTSDIVPFGRNGNNCPIYEEEVLVRISQEVFIFIHLEK